MRIKCPICGERDRREFYYYGEDDYLDRPPEGDIDAMHRYLHIRQNTPGIRKDLWHHEAGCSSWLVLERNTTTHEILGVELATKVVS